MSNPDPTGPPSGEPAPPDCEDISRFLAGLFQRDPATVETWCLVLVTRPGDDEDFLVERIVPHGMDIGTLLRMLLSALGVESERLLSMLASSAAHSQFLQDQIAASPGMAVPDFIPAPVPEQDGPETGSG